MSLFTAPQAAAVLKHGILVPDYGTALWVCRPQRVAGDGAPAVLLGPSTPPPRRNRSSYASEAMLRATISITFGARSGAELQSPSSDEAKEASLGEHPLSSGRHHLLKGGISGGSRRDTGAEVVAGP